MGMFGQRIKAQEPFDPSAIFERSKGMSNPPLAMGGGPLDAVTANMPEMSAPKIKGPGFNFIDALGYLGDAFAENGNQYGQAKQSEREYTRQDARYKQMLAEKRYQDGVDFNQSIALKNATPNDTERDYEFWQSKLTGPQFEQWKAQASYDKPIWQTMADGSMRPVQRSTALPEIGTEIDDFRKAVGKAVGGPDEFRNVLDKFGADAMRRTLGDQGFREWVKKNGLTVQGGM